MATDTTSAQQAPDPPEVPARRPMFIGKGWVQAVAIVMLFGFFVMGILS